MKFEKKDGFNQFNIFDGIDSSINIVHTEDVRRIREDVRRIRFYFRTFRLILREKGRSHAENKRFIGVSSCLLRG